MTENKRRRLSHCTKSDIVRGIQELGLGKGHIVLVHSSMKSLGHVEGGPDAVIDALLECLGESGTLLMPTFTGSPRDSKTTPPIFDVANTQSYTGLIPETFRKRPGVVRSLHPTHSVASFGPATDRYLQDHEKSPTPCGWETPFGRLIRDQGIVLFIGATLESCTLFHSCEEFAGVNYHMQREPVTATVILPDGAILHPTLGIHWWNPDATRDFPALEPILAREGALTVGKAGEATLRLLKAKPAHAVVMGLLARDPLALLKRRTCPLE